jgi:hypothetical protein
MLDDNMPMIAQALAFSTFMAIPAVLLVALGAFTLFASPQAITTLMDHFGSVMPQQATQLLGKSLTQLTSRESAGLTITVIGLLLALWSTTGAMTSYMAGMNIAYHREETRGFLRKRVIALAMVAIIGAAFLLVAVLLIFGPPIEHYLGQALGIEGVLGYVWWAAQWPILLLAARGVCDAAVPRPGRGRAALEPPQRRHRRRGRCLARRLRPVRVLHRTFWLLQQVLGLARGGDRDADLALADESRAALRRRAERRSGAQPRPPRRPTDPAATAKTGPRLTGSPSPPGRGLRLEIADAAPARECGDTPRIIASSGQHAAAASLPA